MGTGWVHGDIESTLGQGEKNGDRESTWGQGKYMGTGKVHGEYYMYYIRTGEVDGDGDSIGVSVLYSTFPCFVLHTGYTMDTGIMYSPFYNIHLT